MKKVIIGMTLMLCLCSSCESILDVAPEGRKSLDDVFASEITTAAYLNGCYQNFPQLGFMDFFFTSMPIGLSDDAWEFHTAQNSVLVQAYKGGITPQIDKNLLIKASGACGSFFELSSWDLYYRNINRCNIFLEHINNAVVPSESERERWIAEARVLRAFYYMELMGRFGGVALLKNSSSVDFDKSTLHKSSFKECADFVISECKDVIENSVALPWRISVVSEKERMTKSVAAAIISRVALWAASPLWNDGNNYWSEAEILTKYALDKLLDNDFSLYTEVRNPSVFGDNAYFEYNCSDADVSISPNDKETILLSRITPINWWDIQGTPINTPNKVGLCPTQELVDAYPMKSGKYILDLKKPYNDEKHLSPNFLPNSGYDEQNPYVNRDPRFYAVVLYNGSEVLNSNGEKVMVETYNGGNCGLRMGTEKNTCTGYYARKHYHPLARKNGPYFPMYPRYFRLAEMYLNYAEASAENNNLDNAIKAIEPIRSRVGMPNIENSSKEDVILRIRNERRIEMAYENNRYYDIRRWTNPGEDMSVGRFLTGMWIEKLPNGKFEYQRFQIGDIYDKNSHKWSGTGWERACYTSKYLLHPLEQSEADRLYISTGEKWQNPGW